MSTRIDSRARKPASPDTPACANEWVRGICEKPRIKCAGCVLIGVSYRSQTTLFAGTCLDWTPRGSPSSRRSIRSCRTRPVSFLPSTSTSPAGVTIRRRLPTRAASWVCPSRSNDRARARVPTSGSSSRRRSPRPWHVGSVRTCLPRRWRGSRTLDSIRTIVSFQVKTRCHKAGSGT